MNAVTPTIDATMATVIITHGGKTERGNSTEAAMRVHCVRRAPATELGNGREAKGRAGCIHIKPIGALITITFIAIMVLMKMAGASIRMTTVAIQYLAYPRATCKRW